MKPVVRIEYLAATCENEDGERGVARDSNAAAVPF